LPPNPAIPQVRTVNPSYEQVSAGNTGHTEAIRVSYDPQKVSYPQLLDYFWRHIDPTVKNRQFCDIGTQYRSGIYWQNEAERKAAESSRDALLASGKLARIETEIIAAAQPSTRPRSITRTTTRKTRSAMPTIACRCGRDARRQADLGGWLSVAQST
jgi:peptide-methionine (S)-S-oxide reductase